MWANLVLYGTVYMVGDIGMTTTFVDRAVGAQQIPASVRGLSSLPDIDYADYFSLATDLEATPEQWARAMFGGCHPLQGLPWNVSLGGELALHIVSRFWLEHLGRKLARVSHWAPSCATTGVSAMSCGPRCPPSIAGWRPDCSATPLPASEQPDEDAGTCHWPQN